MARSKIQEKLISPRKLSASIRDEMFELFAAHYDAVRRATFEEDLSNKDLVILLCAPEGRLLGFTTLSIHEAKNGLRPIRYIFSGDTVMDSKHWGHGHLLRSWFRVAGSIKAQAPRKDLYWFLIVKGHRTYRILEAFFYEYAPRVTRQQDPSLIRLRNKLARKKFGAFFDPSTGLIEFPASRGQLATRFQDAHALVSRPMVRDFLRLNPNYAHGVELACIAKLSETNLKSYATEAFRRGLRGKPSDSAVKRDQ
jgi:hypothetical protein